MSKQITTTYFVPTPRPTAQQIEKVSNLPDRIKCNLTWRGEMILFHPRLFGDQQDEDLFYETIEWLREEDYHGEIVNKNMGFVYLIVPRPVGSRTRARKARK